VRRLCASIALLLVATTGAPLQAQTCDGRREQRVDQETYLALTDRVYVYAPDISSSSNGGWAAVRLRVLAATYRKPMLLARAFMKEKDLQSLVKGRRDIRVVDLPVPAFDPRGARTPGLGSPVTIKDGERAGNITVRVTRVVPVSKGTDHLFVVCTPGR
jgi:hypothetical protein